MPKAFEKLKKAAIKTYGSKKKGVQVAAATWNKNHKGGQTVGRGRK